MSYVLKIKELHSKGWSLENIVQNIYLNYSSSCEKNDEIYKIKKAIKTHFNICFSRIKLIGSSHLGGNFKGQDICTPKDYDFCIIDETLFGEYLYKEMLISKKNNLRAQLTNPRSQYIPYVYNLLSGKAHVTLYSDKDLRREIKDIIEQIRKELDITLKISIVIFLNENFFLKDLEIYIKSCLLEKTHTDKIKKLESLEFK